jgi:hypothetical protein
MFTLQQFSFIHLLQAEKLMKFNHLPTRTLRALLMILEVLNQPEAIVFRHEIRTFIENNLTEGKIW